MRKKNKQSYHHYPLTSLSRVLFLVKLCQISCHYTNYTQFKVCLEVLSCPEAADNLTAEKKCTDFTENGVEKKRKKKNPTQMVKSSGE